MRMMHFGTVLVVMGGLFAPATEAEAPALPTEVRNSVLAVDAKVEANASVVLVATDAGAYNDGCFSLDGKGEQPVVINRCFHKLQIAYRAGRGELKYDEVASGSTFALDVPLQDDITVHACADSAYMVSCNFEGMKP